LYLENESQTDGLLSLSLLTEVVREHGFESVQPLLSWEAIGKLWLSRGYVCFERLAQFAAVRYSADVTLASWTWRALLQDRLFFEYYHPKGDVVGRDYVLDVRHVITGQTREEWIAIHGVSEVLRSPAEWVIGIDSLKRQYHRLYVHRQEADGSYNQCRDGHHHQRYVAAQGYSSDMRDITSEELDKQANEQGLNPCVFSSLYEWILLWL
jgi:hypothetical protein